MKNVLRAVAVVALVALMAGSAYAQIYAGPQLGFRSYGLKGTITSNVGGNVSTGNVVDAGKTAFDFGATVGYQILPKNVMGGWYKLDIDLDFSYSGASFFEAGINSNKPGDFAARGWTGGTTTILSFDLKPINRLTIPSFKLIQPFLGLGLSMNIMSTSDITIAPPGNPGTLTGKGDFKMGLLIFYGAIFHVTDMVQPFISFQHMVPFGSETVFTSAYNSSNGGGSTNVAFSLKDVPGYFSLNAGVRFSF